MVFTQKQTIPWLALSFFEGGLVMAAELIGARMLAPYYGSSLYVWATVMTVTLIGLASGYFAGGWLSKSLNKKATLFYVIWSAGLFMAIMPITVKLSFVYLSGMELLPATLVSCLAVLFPPVFFFGAVSPLIISLVEQVFEGAGNSSGRVYGISTLGGILFTLLFGFHIIPEHGLAAPAVICGLILSVTGAIYFLTQKVYWPLLVLVGFGVLLVYKVILEKDDGSRSQVLYESEGIMGQVLVVETNNGDLEPGLEGKSRWLYVNRISQTMWNPFADRQKGEEAYFTYIYRILDVQKQYPRGSRALIFGLGGGSAARVLSQNGWQVDACEIDARMAHVARKYFFMPETVNVTIDDARHFLNKCDEKYDLILMDTFRGEESPGHVVTAESLKKLRAIMTENATVVLNSHGYLEGPEGAGFRALWRTFSDEGFLTRAHPTEPSADQRNLLLLAKKQGEFPNWTYLPPPNGLKDDERLTDDRSNLDHMNRLAARRWRMYARSYFYYHFDPTKVPVFL